MAYILSFVLMFFPYFPVLNAVHEDDISPTGETCVWFQGYRSAGVGRAKLKFFNSCGKSRYINVCLIDSFGNTQLLKGISRVPSAGTMEFYPFIDREPRSVTWTSARRDPPIPAPC
jgi:hypothetical protein